MLKLETVPAWLLCCEDATRGVWCQFVLVWVATLIIISDNKTAMQQSWIKQEKTIWLGENVFFINSFLSHRIIGEQNRDKFCSDMKLYHNVCWHFQF